MMARRTSVASVIVAAIFVVSLAACDSDSGGGGTDAGSTDVSNVECEVDFSGMTTTTFVAQLQDFQTKAPVSGGVCELLYNIGEENETEGTGCFVTSDANGMVSFDLPSPSRWGWLCKKAGNRDTFQFNITSETGADNPETLWLISQGLYELAPALAGINLDTTKGVTAGRLTWFNESNEEEFVGCGVISLEGPGGSAIGGDIRYFGSQTGLPTTIDDRTKTAPENGLFLGGNIDEGIVDMVAKIDGEEINRVTIFSQGGAVVISNIEQFHPSLGIEGVEMDANPTPAGCQ